MVPEELLAPIDPRRPYDDGLDPYVGAFIHLTFRETERATPDASWLDRITAATPAVVASMLHATAHHVVRGDRPFRDVLSFGLGAPRRQPYWNPALEALDNLLELGSLDWATLFVTWEAGAARLVLCDEEDGVRAHGTLESFVADGVEELLRAPASDDDRRAATEVLDGFRVHITRWADALEHRLGACREAAARLNAELETLDLGAPGAEARLDALGAAEARLAARITSLEPALFRARRALRELGGG